MRTFRFFDFPVYTQAKGFYKQILVISLRVKDYSFRDQIKRAALSVVLNIAEGSAKKSDKEFAKFLEISIASANEVAACIDLMFDFKRITQYNDEKGDSQKNFSPGEIYFIRLKMPL